MIQTNITEIIISKLGKVSEREISASLMPAAEKLEAYERAGLLPDGEFAEVLADVMCEYIMFRRFEETKKRAHHDKHGYAH